VEEEGSAAVGVAAQGQAWSRAGGGHEARVTSPWPPAIAVDVSNSTSELG